VRLALGTLAPSPGAETRFLVSVTPDVPGIYWVLVDGAKVSACFAPYAGGCDIGTGVLSSGRHVVTATFSPTEAGRYAASQSAPYSLTTP
jgi:hypothetical protein